MSGKGTNSNKFKQFVQTTETALHCRPHVAMGAGFGICRFRQIFPGKMEVAPWHVILVAGPPAAGKLGAEMFTMLSLMTMFS